ncbi:MAG TPA: hypothetical protein VHU62_13875 [Mycobacterium sp.]|nr:hypothetical protein [Mycobacterium sp.]
MAVGSWPSLGSGAPAFALGGLCPVGRPPDGGNGLGAAGGWAAAAPVHPGSAVAGGATPIVMQSPIAAADATDIEAIRGRAGMSHLSRGTTSH